MCTPAAACRLFAANVITPLYRDYFAIVLIANAIIQNGALMGPGDPIHLERIPAEGQIIFFNENQYVYNTGEKYEIRELTSTGKRLQNFSQFIGSMDENIGWISLTGLIVLIGLLILMPPIRATVAFIQWTAAVTATLATFSALVYQRRLVLQVS